MREVVLDASVVLKWFRTDDERHSAQARELRRAYESGELRVHVPPLLLLEVLNVAGRSWGWASPALEAFADRLSKLGFERVEPQLVDVARWTAAGLTAYDASYVAAAEQLAVPLVTDDDELAAAAPGVASPLVSTSARGR